MRRLSLSLALLAAFPAVAQETARVREVLEGENATVIFSPNGGYSPQNYLKRFTNKETGQQEWATQEGAVAEMILRCEPNTKARVATFRMSPSSKIADALFWVAQTKNVDVKLWLKGPPGLDYMLEGHRQIADRANGYLRRRAKEGKQDEWGEIQVMIGTADKMHDFGKVNDMHQKFGIFNIREEHAPGFNNAFMGTSNLSDSSDLYHNEHRIIFHSNPKVAQRLWGEFKRCWDNLGEGETYIDGDIANGSNITPETAKIHVAGGTADEEPGDPLQLRFTYEKRDGNSFHRISRDFVAALDEADNLPAGETVYVAQFGFQIGSIADALERAARRNPKVNFRIMVHTKEGEGWSARRLAQAGLPNLQVRVKWDSNKLILNKGQSPRLPDHGDPMPALLHHKSMIVGKRIMITGSFNFFGDADSQGENVVIIRNHLDRAYEQLLDDARAEFSTMWEAPVFYDVAKLHGPDGLLSTLDRLSDEDGFLETLRAVSSTPRTAERIYENVRSQPGAPADLTVARVSEWLDVLTRFQFVDRDADDRFRLHGDPDALAHVRKPIVREQALAGPQEGVISGKLTRSIDGALQLDTGTQSLFITGDSELTDTLWELTGRGVTIAGTIDKIGGELEPTALQSPQLQWIEGAAGQEAGEPRLTVSGTPLEVAGPAAGVVRRADEGQKLEVKAYVWDDAIYATGVKAWPNRSSSVSYKWVPVGRIEKDQPVEILYHGFSGYTKVRLADGVAGYVRTSYLDLSRNAAGMLQSIPGAGN